MQGFSVGPPQNCGDGLMALDITSNGKLRTYYYRCHEDPSKSKDIFETYYYQYHHNKGKLLAKLRKFNVEPVENEK